MEISIKAILYLKTQFHLYYHWMPKVIVPVLLHEASLLYIKHTIVMQHRYAILNHFRKMTATNFHKYFSFPNLQSACNFYVGLIQVLRQLEGQ